MNPINEHPTRLRKKILQIEPVLDNKEKNRSIKKVSVILKKAEELRTAEENDYLFKYAEIAKEAATRLEKREQIKNREKEFEDSEEALDEKCLQLAEAIRGAQYLVVYTGAGISTAARIPDYRGTSGIWTLLQQGKDIGEHDLTQAEPTFTHMALAEMYYQGRLKHVVSQNCDGLHLRSGLSRKALSELHGNMYIEVCRTCRPFREYLRLFDVTENTARFSHRTYRRCYLCHSALTDSIVHFGERGNLPWPLNWKGACRAAEEADVILCMGSSLKVLKRYPWLWSMDRPAKRRPKLYIVNLQWTPKDCQATMKIHGKCDAVMRRLTKFLGIQVIVRRADLLQQGTLLTKLRQLLGYADDTDLLARRQQELTEAFTNFERESRRAGLLVNEGKTKYMVMNRQHQPPLVPLTIDNYKFEQVPEYKREKDPLFWHATALCPEEKHTTNRACLEPATEELIVITVASDAKSCCDAFSTEQIAHDTTCKHFCDASNDIPVILQSDREPESALVPVLPAVPPFSLMESVFFNYLYSLISSLTTYHCPQPCLSLPSTSQLPESYVKMEVPSTPSSPPFKKQRLNPTTTLCSFCVKQYATDSCQFYDKYDASFKPDVSACLCCDDDDNEEADDINDNDDEKKQPDDMDGKLADVQKPTSNPGWYGRGYRKRVKKKR